MIVELKPDDFPSVWPLYRAAGVSFPLISAVIQKKQRGQVFVDDRGNPGSAVVLTDFGFMLFLGAEQNESFDEGFAQLLATGGALRPSYILWYAPPAEWQGRLDLIGPDLVRRRERIRFEFRQESADYLKEPARCPAGMELKNLSADLLPKTEKFDVRIDSRFWSSAADAVEHGLGVCLLKDGEVISLCYAAAAADGLAEVDVVTDPAYRGGGLATVAAQQFIRGCLSRGISPTWDCFVYNAGSVKLAEKLGFVQANSYPFYSFNVPIELAAEVVGQPR